MEALRELDEWSWEGYAEKLAAKGYELYLRKDEEKVVRGYVLHKGSSRFKGSELGKGRNLTASRTDQTGKPDTEATCCNGTRTVRSHRSRTEATD